MIKLKFYIYEDYNLTNTFFNVYHEEHLLHLLILDNNRRKIPFGGHFSNILLIGY